MYNQRERRKLQQSRAAFRRQEPDSLKTQAYHLTEWQKSGHADYLSGLLSPLEIKDQSTVLDLGCGSGYINAYLVSSRTLRRNFGLDLDWDTLRLARELNADSGGISWVCASAAAIPLPDASVNHIVCRAVLPYAHVGQVLAEVSRVLQPQGTAVFLLHSWTFYLRWLSPDPRQWKRSLAGLLHFHLGLWFNLTGRQFQISLGQRRLGQTFQTEFRLRRMLQQQGLSIYKVIPQPEFLLYARKRAPAHPTPA